MELFLPGKGRGKRGGSVKQHKEMLWGGRWEGGSCLGTHVRIKDFKIKKKKKISARDLLFSVVTTVNNTALYA